jgi:WD40 repeat protein
MFIAYKRSHCLKGHTDSVAALAFTPDGSKLASAACDGRVIIWSTKEGKAIYDIAMQSLRFTCVAWLDNALAIAGTESGNLVTIQISKVCFLSMK